MVQKNIGQLWPFILAETAALQWQSGAGVSLS